jgi:hypothetical protein
MIYREYCTTCRGQFQCIVAYLDDLQAKVKALRELQSASGEELRPLFGRMLMPSILDKAFKGEL